MNQYVTGAVIKALREKNQLTQAKLAERLMVSDKTVSIQLVKLYPDGNAGASFQIQGVKEIFCYCNRDGLFKKEV